MHNEQTDILALFEGECEGGNDQGSDHAPRTEQAGDQRSAPGAGEQQTISREEAFRTLMEGEYKDLFTAYFQQAFNRRFKEHKEIKEELEAARHVMSAVSERFGGLSGAELLNAIRTETVLKNASAEAEKPLEKASAQTQEMANSEIKAACESERRRLLESIRARGMRPAENGLFTQGASVGERIATTREERAEMARRAANGERIIL